MKTFRIPEDVELINPVTRRPFAGQSTKSFREYAVEAWLGDPRIVQQRKDLPRLLMLIEVFDKAVPGTDLALEDADYERLVPIVQDRPAFYSPPIVEAQLMVFDEAFLGAK